MRTVRFDGYAFGDRMLEGVCFLADIDETDPESIEIENVRIAPDCDDEYWKELNTKKWLKLATRYVCDSIDEAGVEAAIDNLYVEPV